jgi:hypothetical protein
VAGREAGPAEVLKGDHRTVAERSYASGADLEIGLGWEVGRRAVGGPPCFEAVVISSRPAWPQKFLIFQWPLIYFD